MPAHRRGHLALFAAVAAAALASGPAPARAEDLGGLWAENRRLAAETDLAQKPKAYFVLDLRERRILLRARGFSLREMPIADAGLWGRRPAIRPTRLDRKDALSRPEIRPGEERTQENLDEQILELADMPAAFRLFLADGVEVRILPAAEGFRDRLRLRAALLGWRLTRPLATLRDRRRRVETTTIFLVLRAEDARALYWSFYEGIEGVLVPP